MTEKEIRRLGRDDLLNMLVSQSSEVRRLRGERDSLITQLRYFEGEFNRVGSLDAILGKMGIRVDAADGAEHISALEELLRQFENEETTQDLFDEDVEANAPNAGDKPAGKRTKRNRRVSRKRPVGQNEPVTGFGADASRENANGAEDASANAKDRNRVPAAVEAKNGTAADLLTDDMDAEENLNPPEAGMDSGEATESDHAEQPEPLKEPDYENEDAREMRKPGFMKGTAKQSRVQEAFAWAKMQFGDKKKE